MSTGVLAVLCAAIVVAAPAAAPDRKPPRIVSAAMQDTNGNSRADRVQLTYSEPVRHALDRDGSYPFRVAGYRIRSVAAARGKTLVVHLFEQDTRDAEAKPAIRYRRAKSRPVRDRAGNQARAQLFRAVRAHGKAPPLVVPPTQPPPPGPNQSLPPDRDPDRDGYSAQEDCAPNNAAIHPSAADLPDLAFVDSNCDGIDGREAGAVFASPSGSDTNPGTKAAPKRQIDAAVAAAAVSGRYVLAAAGPYGHVQAQKDVSIYGGYDAANWSLRSLTLETAIVGTPEGMVASGATGVVLQLLGVRGISGGTPGASAYGIRAINGSAVTLQRVTVTAAKGASGAPGSTGDRGLEGRRGADGLEGDCDREKSPGFDFGGAGGTSPAGRHGGKGGDSGYGTASGKPGAEGIVGTPGGAGGKGGNPGQAGGNGQNGTSGERGGPGAGASNSALAAGVTWVGASGSAGRAGRPGAGGGGGGGGGGQGGIFVDDGVGNGGGGGGGGGAPGGPGGGGAFGGGSFGVYLHDSTLRTEASSIATADGGDGGRGGDGRPGGGGGDGGAGAAACTSQVGRGGNGGRGGSGGAGGAGGGGAGGPSIGVMRIGSSTATLTDTRVQIASGGFGGAPGTGASGTPTASQAGIARELYP